MYCTNCGRELKENEVCVCKSIANEPKTPENNMFDSQSVDSSSQSTEDKRFKKKPSWKKVLSGVIAGVISFVICSFIVPAIFEKISDDKTSGSTQVNVLEGVEDDFAIESAEVEYVKGTVNGNAYINQWANIKAVFDDRFTEGTQEDYEDYESLLYDCGAYFCADDDGDTVAVLFYDAGEMTVTEYAEECLEVYRETADWILEDTYSESFLENVNYKEDSKVVEIAGEKYLGVFLTPEVDGEALVVYGDFCAVKDGRIIDFNLTADSVEECIELVGLFETCNAENM